VSGERVVVVGGSVGFDDEALGWPAEVGDDGSRPDAEWDVDVGVGQAAAEDEVEDDVLEDAASGCGAGGEDASESAWAGGDLARVDQAKRLGLPDGSSEALVGQGCREVLEGSGGCRRGDFLVNNGSIEGEVGCAAGAKARGGGARWVR
jgi:hypothetical protein